MLMLDNLLRWLRLAAHRLGWTCRPGQGLVEYALIIALVSALVIAALLVLGPSIAHIFTKINSSL
jgi:hypothetical protein